jgi:DnaD/phage-associated family protein
MDFHGFSDEYGMQVHVPEQFFRHVLLDIPKLDELKLTLYIFWRMEHKEGPFRYLLFSELTDDHQLVQSIANDPDKARSVMRSALRRAVARGTLLQADLSTGELKDKLIFINSPKGRAAIVAIQRGDWKLTDRRNQPIDIQAERPNIFQLYEANIGPLTPLIADALRDAEKTYNADWIEEAFRIAVERNKRNWHYIEAILQRWQEGGHDERKEQQDRRDSQEARRRYGDRDK